jgi:alkanesulfonate monooxygenase SsuD/methylene tetrahydromethanopterin reductase-like flavin-dependent oxidoreductase (luciferase family)
MRLAIGSFLAAETFPAAPVLQRLVSFARQVEAMGFHGIWVGDALGRGSPTLDALTALAALCSATDKIELGTSVLQIPLRQPMELAHRIQTLSVLSQGRLRLGVGAGSTRADFELVGGDFATRFHTLLNSIERMRGAWRGEPSSGIALSPWPGGMGAPPILMGTWRNPRWIEFAATNCDGWIASGLFSKWDDAEAGINTYRAAGGRRAVLTNVPFDTRTTPGYADRWAKAAQISLVGPAGVAREKLQRIKALGFDDVVLVPPDESPEHLQMIKEFA